MIYLLEDDANIRNFVTYALSNSGLACAGFERPSQFWAALNGALPRLALLDVMLPEEDGLSVLKKLRARPDTRRLPVIMLTARSAEYDRVLGLDSGADDYIPKPFGIMELVSRVRALLRRAEGDQAAEKDAYTAGGLYLCLSKRLVRCDGAELALTYKEFELLHLLLSSPGTVFTRERILDEVWGGDFLGESRTLDAHIRSLRQKLGRCGGLIATVRGVGYKIEEV